MLQTSLHDFYKVTGTPPKSQINKSPKKTTSRAGKLSAMTSKEGSSTPSPKRSRKRKINEDQFDESQIETIEEINLEVIALSHINSAIERNNPNEIDLNGIYESSSTGGIKYFDNYINYIGKIRSLPDKSAKSLFKAIFVDVFLVPINCEFFNQIELELIKAIFELSVKSKIIVTRLLKWTKPWYRIQDINDSLYESKVEDFPLIEIESHSDENGIFKIINCDNDDNVLQILQLMNVRELQEISKKLKRPHTHGKEKMIDQLMKIFKMTKSLFPGVKSPRDQLCALMKKHCGPAIQLSDMSWSIIKRLLTLAYPVQSRFEDLKAVIWMIIEVDMGKRIYPDAITNYYPVFRNRQHVIDYTEAKSALVDITAAIASKDWPTVKSLSIVAYDKLMSAGNSDKSFAVNQNDLALPSHIRRFSASYVWSKVLILSIDSPKKDPDYATFVGQFLKSLMNYNGVTCASLGRCCSELSLIEMKYNKNFDECARLIERAMSEKYLSIKLEAELLDRAKMLSTKARDISEIWKNTMGTLYEMKKSKFECLPNENYIEAVKMQSRMATVTKSVWLFDDMEDSKSYAHVEDVARGHYMHNGFPKGLHCEGSLPLTLCACAFWNEIYSTLAPGAFICRYQTAPLDLWSSSFIENRQEQIKERIAMVNRLSVNEFCEIMHHHYLSYQNCSSLISTNLFHDDSDIIEIIQCLGVTKVIELCLVLLNDFYHMSAGFPDLIVWNPTTSKCKIVEVKGPGDSLSVKQKLWINRLTELEIDTEVCYVKAK